MPYLLALDQGTSSSRSILFNLQGEIVASAQREFRQLFPQPGWVEHDPLEIWESQLATCHAVIRQAGIQASDILAIGITNQRETTIVWDKQTGQPLANAIVWQDRRTADQCEQLRAAGHTEMLRQKTGLVPDPYFSATKLSYLLQQIPDAHARAARGEIAFGTVDSWLLWQLTGGRVHATDVTNASRTLMYNLAQGGWDEALVQALGLPPEALPEVHPSSHLFGQTEAHLLQPDPGEGVGICRTRHGVGQRQLHVVQRTRTGQQVELLEYQPQPVAAKRGAAGIG